jgi:hypothetical protein
MRSDVFVVFTPMLLRKASISLVSNCVHKTYLASVHPLDAHLEGARASKDAH